MSIELSRDANRLIEDIELELASIRAAMALRPLEAPQRAVPGAPAQDPSPVQAVRQIGLDLTRSGAGQTPPAAADLADSAHETPLPETAETGEAAEKPRRLTLQERLASMRDPT